MTEKSLIRFVISFSKVSSFSMISYKQIQEAG